MNLTDNSLDRGYEDSEYNSSLEYSAPKVSNDPKDYRRSVFRFDKNALVITFIALTSIGIIGFGVFLYTLLHTNKVTSSLNSSPSSNYSIGSTLKVNKINGGGNQLQLAQASQVTVNGNLNVSKSLVLSPGTKPSAPVAGQIYYNQANNQPYYFNGTQFISLSPQAIPQYVSSLGGANGAVGLGSGLSVSNGSLSVSSTLLQSVNAAVTNPKVSTLQGLSGNVELTAGSGISIGSTTITNSGVIKLNSQDGSVTVTPTGNGTFDLSVLKGGSGNIGLLLAPSGPQYDASVGKASIGINKTGVGNFVDFYSHYNPLTTPITNPTPVFEINQSGQITYGTIDYSQVSNAPATTVQKIGNQSGNITLNANGLTISSTGVLSNTGVTSISGTPNQVTVSSGTGDLTVSLPQDINTSSIPTFSGLSINNGTFDISGGAGSLKVDSGSTVLGGALTVSGMANLNGGASINGLSTTGTTILGSTTTIDSIFGVNGGNATLNGNFLLSNSSGGNTITIQDTATGNEIIQIPNSAHGTDEICLRYAGNCGGASNSILGASAGTQYVLPEYTSSSSGDEIQPSNISDNISKGIVTISDQLSVTSSKGISTSLLSSTGSLTIQPSSGSLLVGVTNVGFGIVGDASSYLSVGNAMSGNQTNIYLQPKTGGLNGINNIYFPAEGGTVCLESSSNCGFSAGDSGVTKLNGLTGQLTLNNVSTTDQATGTITIQNALADNSTKGITSFTNDFTEASAGVIDTVQQIQTNSNVQFGSLVLGTGSSSNVDLSVTNIKNKSSSKPLFFDDNGQGINFKVNGSTFNFPTGGSSTETICTTSTICSSGVGAAVLLGASSAQSDNTTNDSIAINKTGSSGDILNLEKNASSILEVKYDGTTTLTGQLTANNGIVTNTITPNAALTIGVVGQSITLQGNGSSVFKSKDATSTYSTTIAFDYGTLDSGGSTPSTPINNVEYYFENNSAIDAKGNSFEICTSAGNCTGLSGSVTANGTSGYIARFSGPGSLVSSSYIQEASNLVTIGTNLNVSGVSGGTTLSLGTPGSNAGLLSFSNPNNNNTLSLEAGITSSSITFKLPINTGSAGQCLTTDGGSSTGTLSFANCLSGSGGGSGGVTGLNGISGNITINNASVSGSNITIDSASKSAFGLVELSSSGNLALNNGILDTAQSIQTTSTPTFKGLTIQSSGLSIGTSSTSSNLVFYNGVNNNTATFSLGTIASSETITIPNTSGASGTLLVNTGANLTASNGSVSTIQNPSFTTSVTTPLLTSSGSLAIQPPGTLTIGSNSKTFNLSGDISSTITGGSSSGSTALAFSASQSGSNTITIPAVSGTLCVNVGGVSSCNGAGGGGANIALSDLSSVAINSTLQPGNGNLGTVSLGSASLPFQNLFLSGGASIANSGSNNFEITGTASGLDVITLPDVHTGTLCTNYSNCGAAPVSGDTNYILNSTTSQNGNINLVATNASASPALILKGASSKDIADFVDSGGTTVGSISSTGNFKVTGLDTYDGTQLILGANSASISLGGSSTGKFTNIASGNLDSSGTSVLCLNGYNNLSGCSNTYIYSNSNSTTPQIANISIQSSGISAVSATIEAANGQTADILDLSNHGGGTPLAKFDYLGNLTSTSGSFTGLNNSNNGLSVTNSPYAATGVSLLQLGGSAIAPGQSVAGGTYIGINAPSSSTADFLNFENNNNIQLQVSSAGALTAKSGTFSSGGLTLGNSSTAGNIYIYSNGHKTNLYADTTSSTDSSVVIPYSSTTATVCLSTLTTCTHGGGSGSGYGVTATSATMGYIPYFDSGSSTPDIMNSPFYVNTGTTSYITENGGTNNYGQLGIISSSTTQDGLFVQGFASTASAPTAAFELGSTQTSDLLDLLANNGNKLASVDYQGNLSATSGTFSGLNASSHIGINIQSAPYASTSLSLFQLGTAINSTYASSSGTYIGINGSTASDYINFQNSGITKFSITSAGTITAAGNETISGTLNIGSISSLGTTAVNVTSSSTGDGMDINLTNTSGTQTNGILISRNGSGGTTTNLLNIYQSFGTATNGITFSGTIGTLINAPTGSNNILAYNNASLINGVGILQSAALSGTYSNMLTLSSSSNSFTGTSATISGTLQGGTVTATSTLNVGNSSTAGSLIISAGSSGNLTINYTGGGTNNALTITGGPSAAGQCLVTSSGTQASFSGCNTSRTKDIVIPAEYAGAVLDSASDGSCNPTNNIGTMTSGYSGDTTPQQNYYQWSTSQGSAQCYDVVLQVPVPADWSSWTGSPYVYATDNKGSSNSSALSVAAYETSDPSSGSPTVNTIYGYTPYSTNGTSALAPVTIGSLSGGTSNGTPSYITLKFRLTANNGGSSNTQVQLGNIVIPYTSLY